MWCSYLSQNRFIPAGAGNTAATPRRRRSAPVHPRRRGEHDVGAVGGRLELGSSPQARGTHKRQGGERGRGRFIPAGAGNTYFRHGYFDARAVHPRRRGEHIVFSHLTFSGIGSSPQARGTQLTEKLDDPCWRFIPAGAGNTVASLSSILRIAVHPRRRGEHGFVKKHKKAIGGSSPQARGTQYSQAQPLWLLRFIPAGAGNTAPITRTTGLPSVHPRRRGEHNSICNSGRLANGSSPQARGTLLDVREKELRHRFIPAGAGNTPHVPAYQSLVAVHPRRRGEHAGYIDPCKHWHGSSPQARGTLMTRHGMRLHRRFIPAGAGNTSTTM